MSDINKYVSGSLLTLLFLTSQYYVPHPIFPVNVINIMMNYKIVGFILTLLLSYLLIKDMRVSIVVAIVLYVINHIITYHDGFDSIQFLVNKYNYQLDKYGNKNPIQENNSIEKNTNEKLPSLPQLCNYELPDDYNKYDKQLEKDMDSYYTFSEDNLRYLNAKK